MSSSSDIQTPTLLSAFLGRCAAACIIAMVVVISINVGGRYLFSWGSLALQELEWHLFAASFLFAGARTLALDGHVRVDVWYAQWPQRRQDWINIIGFAVLGLPICVVLIDASIDFVSYSWQLQESSSDPGGLPFRFIPKAFLPIAFLAFGIELLVQTAKRIRNSGSTES